MENQNIEFYTGDGLLKKKDINGKKPRFYMSVGGRSTGKTTFWNGFLLKQFINNKEQFVLFYRYKYEIDNIAKRFFGAVDFQFPDYEMTDKNTENLGFTYLFLNKKLCGYAIAINSADNIKKYSNIFKKVKWILFDEFIPETTPYCPKELKKFLSLYISIARGEGKALREDVTFIMLANLSTMDNLYFRKFKIIRTHENTRYQRCNGVVVEFVENKQIQEIQQNDIVVQLLDDGYISGLKTNDNFANVEKRKIGKPVFNFYVDNEIIGVYNNEDCLYISEKTNNKEIYKYFRNEDCDYKYSQVVKNSFQEMLDTNKVVFENIHVKNLIII